MEEVEVIIIGAGVVGLAIAYELSKTYEGVLLVEQESGFGKHTSSRNSEVIHSGIYYQKDSLKAKLCVRGNKLLYGFANKYGVKYKKCGKIVVATSQEELPELKKLKVKGEENGVENLTIIEKNELKKLCPVVKAISGLWVPDTGIIDTHKFMQTLDMLVEKNNGMIAYNTEVTDIKKESDYYILRFSDDTQLKTKILINSAGLFSEKISKMLGIETVKNNLKLYLCKGEYYKSSKIKNIEHLIYPLPDPKGIFLGIHLTINLQGEVRFGPNAYYVDTFNYKMDSRYKKDFVEAISRYMDIDATHLQPDDVGMRAKLQGPDDGFRDFYINEESDKGLNGYINLTGIESPGLTSSLAIAELVEDIVNTVNII